MAPPGRCPGFLLGPFPGRLEPGARHPSPDCPAPSPRQGLLPAPGPLPARGPVGGRAGCVRSTLAHAQHTRLHTAHGPHARPREVLRGAAGAAAFQAREAPRHPGQGGGEARQTFRSKTRLGSRRPRSPEPGLRGPGEPPTSPSAAGRRGGALLASDLGNTLALQEDLSGREFRGASSGRR